MSWFVDQLAHVLNTYGPRAAELREAGWYFEEGGCFGMALAIADAIQAAGGVAALAVRPGPGLHAIAITNGRGLDWQGTVANLAGYQTVTPRRFAVLAQQHGHTAADLAADRAWARDVIRLARELATDAPSGLGAAKRHRISHADIEAMLRATDGSGDPDWLAYLFAQVRTEPCWELRQVRLAKLDTGETRAPDVIAEYAELDPKTRPPIVVARDGSVLDGGHRAQAAMARGERMITAYVPCGH